MQYSAIETDITAPILDKTAPRSATVAPIEAGKHDRIYREVDDWYFAARNGAIGPFATRANAEAALKRFVRRKDPRAPSRPAIRIIKNVARRTSRRLLPLSA